MFLSYGQWKHENPFGLLAINFYYTCPQEVSHLLGIWKGCVLFHLFTTFKDQYDILNLPPLIKYWS
jgi:hypothetical protein